MYNLLVLLLFLCVLLWGNHNGNALSSIPFRVGVIGGGASGMFAATACAGELRKENNIIVEVVVLEGSANTMSKVKISGGGRCNVLHDTSKATTDILTVGYPRGKKELNGIFQKHFTPSQMKDWFTSRGVSLKTEADGRMFPTTDNSQTIMDCINNEAQKNHVTIRTKQKVISIVCDDDDDDDEKKKFQVHLQDGAVVETFDCIIFATGSSKVGYELAQSLGHTIVPPVPSLFTLNAKPQVQDGGIFHGLSGLSVPSAKISFRYKVPGKKKKKEIVQEGPLLITHYGLSGPAALRLSAFAARELHDVNYRGDDCIHIHWAPSFGSAEQIEEILWKMTSTSPKKAISSICPLLVFIDDAKQPTTAIPKRLWTALVVESGFSTDTIWCEAPKKKVKTLSRNIANFALKFTGKGTFKEEFVTAGGISLKEIAMKTMESKICPNLYFCGEMINVDGITGGYNFMNCWSTGYVAGTSAASTILTKLQQQQPKISTTE